MQIYALMSAVFASSDSSSGNLSLIGLLFFATGFVFYGYVFLRYRNSDKRFQHEAHTERVTTNMQADDVKVDSLKDLRSSKMKGANSRSVKGSQNSISGLLGAAGDGSTSGIIDQVMRFRPDK